MPTFRDLNLLTPLNIGFILPEPSTTIRTEGKVAWVNHTELIKKPDLPVGMRFNDSSRFENS